jgi:hypothetical protein
VFGRRGKVRWQFEQNRRSHFRQILKQSGIKGHFCLRLFLSEHVDPFHQLLQLVSIEPKPFQSWLHSTLFAQEMDGHAELRNQPCEVGAQNRYTFLEDPFAENTGHSFQDWQKGCIWLC